MSAFTCACSSVLLLTRSRSLQIILWDVMAGGIDTTATSIEWLIYILIKNPRVQTKMQEELESVVGTKRLPTFADVENLPYTVAVISECFRFKHFAPFGIPHSTTKDTTLGGYRVPKAAQVMINIYALHMDPENWKDPEEFRPERFLEEEKVGQRKSPPPPPPSPRARAARTHCTHTYSAHIYIHSFIRKACSVPMLQLDAALLCTGSRWLLSAPREPQPQKQQRRLI
jgi:cytochrome P450